ncbi:TNF receptor-associated factor 6-B-like [Amblyomma americanum]
MSPGSQQYTLVGFSAELDWRPLCFVKPIPPSRVCSTCGLVRRRNALLPCSHTLCEFCCEQCTEDSTRVCPLCNQQCEDDDVDWRDFAAEELLKRKVKCWNEQCGCESVMAASELSRHFQRDCGHHSVSCPKCLSRVLCCDVYSHLRSETCTAVKHLQSDAEVPPGCKEDKELLASFRGELEKQVAEMRAVLERLVVDNEAHEEMLNEINEGITTFKNAMEQQLAETTQNNQNSAKSLSSVSVSNQEVKKYLATLRDQMNNLPRSIITAQKTLTDELVHIETNFKAEVKKTADMTLDKIKEFLEHPQIQVSYSTFTVDGVKALKEKTRKEGQTDCNSEKVYLRGYCISPGVFLEKHGESVRFCASMTLYRGDLDEIVEWPFKHNVKLSVLHPKDGSKRELVNKVNATQRYFQRPTEERNLGVFFAEKSFNLDALINDGYVANDELRVKWKLLP